MDELAQTAGAMADRIMGLVLAGGRSLRMGREKALAPLAGRPLLAHVLDRFTPQVASVVINAQGDATRFDAFRLPVLPDETSDGGPLAGVAVGLRAARARGYAGVATCPSDAPFLPANLVSRLAAGMGEHQVAMASGPDGLEPLFALWRSTALPGVEAALTQRRLAVRDVAAELGLAVVPFDAGPPPGCFANLNTLMISRRRRCSRADEDACALLRLRPEIAKLRRLRLARREPVALAKRAVSNA